MKFKSLLLVVGFIPTLVFAQAPVIAPRVVAGTPGANSDGVAKHAAAPVAALQSGFGIFCLS